MLYFRNRKPVRANMQVQKHAYRLFLSRERYWSLSIITTYHTSGLAHHGYANRIVNNKNMLTF
jgi:hypothetical protein